jgi:streptogramin lyase
MLRHVVGDSVFFDILKTYYASPEHQYGTATTEEFQAICEQIAGINLDKFFHQWIYEEYFPRYSFAWNWIQNGSEYNIELEIQQAQTNYIFWMPIDIAISTVSGETTFVVWDSLQTHLFQLSVSSEPIELYIDKHNWILKQLGEPIQPKIMVSDSLIFVADFGTQDTATLTIANIGLDTLHINKIEISGTHFQLIDPLIYPIYLNTRASLKINLRFTFAVQSQVIDTLKLYSNDPNTPIKSVILHGNTIFPAQEGIIYAVTGRLASGVFLTINPDSGNGHIVGPSGFSEITGVAIQPSTGTIYGTIGGIATSQLIKIDAQSGRAFEKITIPVPRLRAIAFDTNDDLYLANLSTSQLYRLNPITGDTTYIGTPKIKNLSGLTINPIDGQLWGTGASDDEIYQINKKTGAAILIGKTGFINTSDLAFDAAGNLYGLSGFSRLNPPTDFIKIDPATGIGTLIGSTGFKAVYSLAIRGKVTSTNIQKLAREQIPTQFDLKQGFPNPFNPSTTIEFALPKSAFVTLKIYNVLGEEVATLIAEQRSAGIHKFNWDARGLASGVYLYRLEAGDFVQMKKLILMR